MFVKYCVPFAMLALAAIAPQLSAVAPQPPSPAGANLFRQRCQTCHAIVPGLRSPLGPNLVGVFGRKAGLAQFNYSPAMKQSGLVWSRDNLERYLAAPAKMVPGSRMMINVSDAKQRALLIDYLEASQ